MPCCCLVFLSFQNWTPEILYVLDSTWITRPLVIYSSDRRPEFFSQSINNELRDTSGEKIPFVTVGITRFVLMLKKIFQLSFVT